MKKIRAIRQHDSSDCGAACLCSIARAFGYDIPLSRVRELASTDRMGTSVAGLVEAAEKMGFLARGVKGPPEALQSAPLPSIAHLELKKNFYHFVVLTRTGKKAIRYMDPETGSINKASLEAMQGMWTGVLVIMAPSTGFTEKKESMSPAARFFRLARPFRSTLLQALTGAILFSLLGLSTSLFVQKIMDYVLVNRNINLLNLMGTAMIILLIARMAVSWFKSLFLLKAGHQIDAGLLLGYYRHLLSLPQRFFDRMQTGEILSRMSDAVKIRVFINQSLVEMCVALMTILLTLLAMALLSWRLCLLVSSALPLYAMLYFICDRVNKKVLRKLQEESASLESQLVESVQSQRTIRAFGWQDWSAGRVSSKLTAVLRESYGAGMASIASGHAAELISSLLTIILLWAGAVKVIDGLISPGELMSFYAMLGYLMGPMKNLGNLNRMLRDALIAADRLFQILDLEHETNNGSGLSLKHLEGHVEFRNVRFRYGSGPELFRDINLRIPFGKTTGIVGVSGCGKSTIAALLSAEHLPSGGSLRFNNCDVRQINKSSLRSRMSIVPQQIELFSGSILENIAPGEQDPDTAKLLRLAARTGLIKLIDRLPAGIYTELGEHGLSLSGGERQRLAFVRALYSEPDMLILDEATAALDPASEADIFELLKEIRRTSMTLVIISHKLQLVRDSDQIILIDNGEAPETGTHTDLVKKGGKYAQLWSLQNPGPH
jgi:ATP-binding cassette subfamily B protein